MHWTEIARRQHVAATAALAEAVNRQTISVPLVGDSDWNTRGYVHEGTFFSCVPDVQYPWDPVILRHIRKLCPDAMPISISSVYRWSNFHENGYIHEPIKIVRHGLARSIQCDDRIGPMHDFYCEMPGYYVPGLRIPGRSIEDCVPNFIEVNWADRQRREYGQDMPGAYLPFDWEFFYALKDAYDTHREQLAKSKRVVDDDGNVIAQGVAADSIASRKLEKRNRDRSRQVEGAYVARDIERFYNIEPSEVELKERLLGGGPEPSKPATFAVSVPENPAAVPPPSENPTSGQGDA